MVKITVKHEVKDIERKQDIIREWCTIEDIEYHLPEFKRPIIRKLGLERKQLENVLKEFEEDAHAELP